jgi:methyl-accepting chemotaxis protein
MQPKTGTSVLKSIFVKLTAISVVITALVAGGLTVKNWANTEALIDGIVRDRAAAETSGLSEDVAGGIRFGRIDKVNEAIVGLREHSEGTFHDAVIVGADGAVIADPEDTAPVDEELAVLARRALEQNKIVTSDDGHLVAAPAHFGEAQDVVGAIATRWSSDAMIQKASEDKFLVLSVIGLIFLVAVAGNAFLVTRTITGPLKRLQSVITTIAARDYQVEVPMQSRQDELGSIARSLGHLNETLVQAQAAELDSTLKSAAFMGSSAAMLLVDVNMVVTHFNSKMVELFREHAAALKQYVPDFDPDNLVGLSVKGFHSNAQHAKADRELKSVGSGAFRTTVKIGDARISLSVSAIRDGSGAAVGYVMEWADVTASWLNAAVINAIEASQIKAEFDLEGQLLSANAPFVTLMGQSQDTIKQKRLSEILLGSGIETQGAPDAAALIRSVLAGETCIGTLKFARTSGEAAIIDGSIGCVRDHAGHPIRLLLLGKDITRSEIEIAASRRQRAEAEKQQSNVVEALRQGLRKLNAGDLTARIDEPFAGNYEELRQDFNSTVQNMSTAMHDILRNAENISNEARDISSTADGLSRRTENTAATLEQTSAALDQLTHSVKATADGAERADQAVSTAKANAENSSKVVVETVAAMDQIASSSERITSIIKVIDDIAFQTNLLALNAGVEAARAGDAGRGFAVVASEVRALAQRSSDAAREINDLIANSAGQVRRGVTLVDKTGEALKEIAGSVSEIAGLVSDIAGASRQQSANLVEINSAVMQLDQSTQQNAARLEETTAASEGLTRDAVALVATVSHFKVTEATMPQPVVSIQSAKGNPGAGQSRPAAKIARSQGNAAVALKPEAAGWEDF